MRDYSRRIRIDQSSQSILSANDWEKSEIIFDPRRNPLVCVTSDATREAVTGTLLFYKRLRRRRENEKPRRTKNDHHDQLRCANKVFDERERSIQSRLQS